MSEQNNNKLAEEKTNETNKTDVYSYHTFILPFYYGKKGNVKAIDDTIFNDNLQISEYLEACDCSECSHGSDNVTYDVKSYFRYGSDNVAYNVKSYFTESANKLVCSKGQLVKVYTLKEQYQEGKFIIIKSKKGEDKEKSKGKIEEGESKGKTEGKYNLDIFNIKLKLYKNGVGLLIYELENRDKKSLDDVNRINEFGRRIRAPFLNAEGQCHLVAKQIEIQFNSNETRITSTFIKDKTEKEENAENENTKKLDEKHIPQVVKKLIFSDNADLIIEAVDDDRMFVCCMVKDNYWSKLIADKKTWKNFSDYQKEKLYKLAYIEGDCSCQSDKMIDQIMDRTMYDRWIKYGTCDFITNHSFVRLTSNIDAIIDSVINPFLYQYVEFAAIALLQRATIKKVQDNLGDINDYTNSLFKKQKITEVSEYYSKQKSRTLMGKITFQEQGDEEYKIIRQELDIDAMKTECDNHLSALYNHFYSEQQRGTNIVIIRLTIAVLLLTFMTIVNGLCSSTNCFCFIFKGLVGLFSIVIMIKYFKLSGVNSFRDIWSYFMKN